LRMRAESFMDVRGWRFRRMMRFVVMMSERNLEPNISSGKVIIRAAAPALGCWRSSRPTTPVGERATRGRGAWSSCAGRPPESTSEHPNAPELKILLDDAGIVLKGEDAEGESGDVPADGVPGQPEEKRSLILAKQRLASFTITATFTAR